MSDEVSKALRDLSIVLAELSAGLQKHNDRSSPNPQAPVCHSRARADGISLAKSLLFERRERYRFLPVELFHEPAWDMLLALYAAQHSPDPVTIGSLAVTAVAPKATSQRWIEHLAKLGLIHRRTDQGDRRKTELSLSELGKQALDSYLMHIHAVQSSPALPALEKI